MIYTTIKLHVKSPEEFKNFLQKECYERFLLDLINRSKLFNNDIIQIESQSRGEYDYISKSSGELYEATLIITERIVNEIIKNPQIWKEEEFAKWIYDEANDNIIQRLKKKKNKNNIILFNIFPMRNPRHNNSIYSKFASDGWDRIINDIISKHPSLIKKNNFNFI
ncbi:MAG TPA: hypothetical protein PKX40_14980 [Spirochaetota bacterium]|nr:hypothetical protein [Spirochaetota bacterium]